MSERTCTACGTANPPRAKFCLECAEPLAPKCAACGTELPAAAKFCFECAHPVDAPPPTSTPSEPPAAAAPAPVASVERSLSGAVAGGRYEIQRFLGEGARKQVYLAHDTRLARDVALAAIRTEGFDATARARVQREAQAMGRLGDHPNIVTLHDIVEEGSNLYIISEYMAGGDLADLVRDGDHGRLPIAETLRIGQQVCAALEHAHARDIIHRDLKPGNVWLDPARNARLGDFGLAVDLERSRITQEGMMLGTVAYMPPEQAVGRPADARSDLYACGAMLYEMVTGRTPFQGDDAVSIITQHINTPPVRPSWHNSEVSPSLDALIMQLLEKAPADRPASAADVRARLQQIAAESLDPQRSVSIEAMAQAGGAGRMTWGRYVGRADQLAQLKAGVDAAVGGRGGMLMVVGEPGIGKTRTTQEIATYAQLRGAQVLLGRCYEGEGAPPFWPWVQIVRAHVAEVDPATLRTDMGSGAVDIAQVVSDVRAQLPDLPEAPKLEPEQERFRLFDSVTTFVKNVSRRDPVLLILDDLHWADKPSLLLLQFLARELRGTRICVLCTYRDVELDRKHPLSGVLGELRTERLYQRVLLRGLSPEEVTEMLAAISQQATDDAQRNLAAAIHRETEGNPFFVEEVLLHLGESGAIYRNEDGEWVGRGGGIEEMGIPEGVREVIGRRLSRLSDPANEVLSIGAVIGRDFELSAVRRISELDDDTLYTALEEAQNAGVLNERQEQRGVYRFSHALLRETLYEELSTPQRVRLHRRVGETLETVHGDSIEAHLPELAHHFTEGARAGGDLERAVDYAIRAAERANTQVAYEEAAAHYNRALQALELQEPLDVVRQADLLLAQGTALSDAGENDASDVVLLRCMEVARRIPAPERFAQAVLKYIFHHFEYGVRHAKSIELAREALALLPETDSPLRAQLFATASLSSFRMRFSAEGRRQLDEARAMAERTGDAEAIASQLHQVILDGARRYADRVAGAERMIELGRETRSHWEVRGHFLRAHLAIEAGDIAAARAELPRLRQLAEECRVKAYEWQVRLVECILAQLAGQFDEAEHIGAEALRIGRRVMENNAFQYLAATIMTIRWFQGRAHEMRDAVAADLERYADVPIYRIAYATMELASGNTEAARAEFERLAGRDFADHETGDLTESGLLAQLADLAVHFGDTRRAGLLYDLLNGLEPAVITVGINDVAYGPVTHWLGTLAAHLERWEDAERHFESALELSERMESPLFRARAQAAYAQMLVARGADGDSTRAVALANDAVVTAQELGLRPTIEAALDVKLRAQGVDPSDLGSSIHAVVATVQQHRTDFAAHAGDDGTVTLMFSDMVGFTEMTERLGDAAAHQVIKQHNAVVRENLARHRGQELELQGDGFLLAFGNPVNALHCAIGIQQDFAKRNAANTPEEIHVRIGLHTGVAIRDADTFFGKTVILASRIASQAGGDEILVSEDLKAATDGADFAFATSREVQLKGLADAYTLHTVAWA